IMGRDTPLYACLEPHPKYEDGYKMAAELREMYESDPDVRKVVDVARGLEGLRRQDGIHAAAVVITRDPLTEYLPIQRKPENGQAPEEAPVVTQYEMHGVEELGLLKMDFLGLRNLDVITDTLELIKQTRGIEVDIDRVPLDDEKTFELLRRGDSIGVFQLEGGPMRALMRSLAPTCFEDVAALVALYRPGPMAANMHNDYADRKNGRKPVEYLHPDAEEGLGDTYRLMIYPAPIEPFADYAFNKSHAYGYGFVSYQTAYLKANYPAEYLAALLTSVKTNLEKAAVYLAECRAMGIAVQVPDINRSDSDFTPVVTVGEDGREERTIIFGLSAVRNVGEGLVAQIIAEREANGPFRDFHDFCQRVDTSVL